MQETLKNSILYHNSVFIHHNRIPIFTFATSSTMGFLFDSPDTNKLLSSIFLKKYGSGIYFIQEMV